MAVWHRSPSATTANASPLVSSAIYAALGLQAVTLGSGDGDSFNYDPNTGRMTQYQFQVNGFGDCW